MNKVRVRLKSKGVKELLKSDEMKKVIQQYGGSVLNGCGDGYTMEDRTYKERIGVSIFPESIEAKRDNSINNTLLKALGSGKK